MVYLFQVFNHIQLATVIKDYYNLINPTKPITQDFSLQMMEAISFAIKSYLKLETDFNTITDGTQFVENKLKLYGIGLVVEYQNYFKSLNENIAEEHAQNKFNPLDNDDIHKAPVKSDYTHYTIAGQMYAATTFIIRNRQFTHNFIKSVINHTIRVF